MRVLCAECGIEEEEYIDIDGIITPCPAAPSGQHVFSSFKGKHDDSPAAKHPRSTEF